MYSLVLVATLSPGADVTPAPAPAVMAAPAIGCSGISAGCTGCTGYAVTYGCSGSCSGCYGSCHGGGLFHGGLFHHKRGGLFHHHKSSCHGCTGCSGCYGSSCFGSSCFGSCTGCGGCNGGGASSWGPPVGMPAYTLHGYGCAGAWGYGPPVVYADPHAVYGTVTNLTPATTVVPEMKTPATTGTDVTPKGTDKGTGTDKDKKMMGANVKFRLPADATLFVDGRATALTGSERVFTTPALAAGKFYYDARAEFVVDGKTVVEEKRVVVEAGSDVVANFTVLLAAAEKKGDAIASK